jgi:hypothetical protein
MLGNIITHNDVAYNVLHQKPIHHFAERVDTNPRREYIEMFQQWCGADIVIQSGTHFMFCKTIPDINFELVD